MPSLPGATRIPGCVLPTGKASALPMQSQLSPASFLLQVSIQCVGQAVWYGLQANEKKDLMFQASLEILRLFLKKCIIDIILG